MNVWVSFYYQLLYSTQLRIALVIGYNKVLLKSSAKEVSLLTTLYLRGAMGITELSGSIGGMVSPANDEGNEKTVFVFFLI